MRGGTVSGGFARFRSLACFRVGLLQAFEIVPPGVVFGRVALAEIPALGAVGRFGRGAIAWLVAAVPVAQPDLGRLARAAVAAPARETPVERTFWPGHAIK